MKQDAEILARLNEITLAIKAGSNDVFWSVYRAEYNNLLHFVSSYTRNLQDAEELVGREIFIDAEEEDDDFEDFTGWTIMDGGRLVGTATGLEDSPGNPCLCVAPASGSGEVLIPLHEDFIVSADPETRTLTMSLPEGLV